MASPQENRREITPETAKILVEKYGWSQDESGALYNDKGVAIQRTDGTSLAVKGSTLDVQQTGGTLDTSQQQQQQTNVQQQQQQAPAVNPAYDASKDLNKDGALTLEELGATAYDASTGTYTMADGTTQTRQDLINKNTTPPVRNTQFDTSTTVNPAYDATKDLNKDGALTLEELGATAYDASTGTYTMADGTTQTQQDLINQTGDTDTDTETAVTDADSQQITSESVVSPVTTTKITDTQVDAGKIADTTGQIAGTIDESPVAKAKQTVATAPTESMTAATYQPTGTKDAIQTEVDKLTAATKTAPTKEVEAATRKDDLQQLGLDAAQLVSATQVQAPDALTAQQTTANVQGDLLNKNISSVDQTQVENAISKTAAATATPSEQATVQGQLANLTANFDAKNPKPWAAGALREANAVMSARGLSASSMAGQAVVQAIMESAIPIAQIDAETFSRFEMQNLSNRQQVAMLAAEQRAKFLELDFNQDFQMRVFNASRVADIANMNFSADQQIALENARMSQTVDLANLTNRQAKVMADAAALTQLDLTELNNAQKASIANAQNFLQLDLTNVSNEQQVSLFKTQAVQQSILSDAAASNAALQFNASSQNQVNMFMAELATEVSKFNADQNNAIERFNAGETNALNKFYDELQNRRDEFNAQNGLIIAQANAAWRQAVTTANNATENEANRINAKTLNEFTRAQIDEIWQKTRDDIAYAYASTESEKDRLQEVLITELTANKVMEAEANVARKSLFLKIATALIGKIPFIGKLS